VRSTNQQKTRVHCKRKVAQVPFAVSPANDTHAIHHHSSTLRTACRCEPRADTTNLHNSSRRCWTATRATSNHMRSLVKHHAPNADSRTSPCHKRHYVACMAFANALCCQASWQNGWAVISECQLSTAQIFNMMQPSASVRWHCIHVPPPSLCKCANSLCKYVNKTKDAVAGTYGHMDVCWACSPRRETVCDP
jgi:hypothetical protein